MVDSVTVTAPARIHLGFLDLNGGLGRRFGSLGLAIDRPATRLSLARAAKPSAEGQDAERARRYLADLAYQWGLTQNYALTIHEAIPSHAGLGSGTKLALSLAKALRHLESLPSAHPSDALLLGRGARSGIGIGLFDRGGLVVDGGRGPLTSVPPVVARMEFPPKWRVLLVIDPSMVGSHGSAEQKAFAELADLSPASAAEICRLVLIKALPALAEADIGSFGDAIARIQEITGDYFAPVQGGTRFLSPAVARVMEMLCCHGAKGAGQSSWGPTGFAFAATAAEAQRLCDIAQDTTAALGLDMLICRGINHGALVEGKTFAAIK
jgi:beta-RFAP synthase